MAKYVEPKTKTVIFDGWILSAIDKIRGRTSLSEWINSRMEECPDIRKYQLLCSVPHKNLKVTKEVKVELSREEEEVLAKHREVLAKIYAGVPLTADEKIFRKVSAGYDDEEMDVDAILDTF